MTKQEHDKRSVVGDDIEGNHIPASAQVIRNEEVKRRRKLTPAEKTEIKRKGAVLSEPKDVHASGATKGGKNTKSLQESDMKDLRAAADRDALHTKNELIKRGGSEQFIDKEIERLHKMNENMNVYHPTKPIPLSTD